MVHCCAGPKMFRLGSFLFLKTHTKKREIVQLISLSIPIALSEVAFMAIAVTDAAMMGRLGRQELGAGALAIAIQSFCYIFSVGVLDAVNPMVGQALGAKRKLEIEVITQEAMKIGLIMGGISILAIWNTGAILIAFNQSAALALLAEEYNRVAIFGFIPGLWFVVLGKVLAVHGRPAFAMYIVVIAIFLNALGNAALMFGNFGFPKLGLIGASYTSSSVRLLMFIALAACAKVILKFRFFVFRRPFEISSLKIMLRLLTIGIPIGSVWIIDRSLSIGTMFVAGTLGPIYLASHIIVFQIYSITVRISVAMSQATSIRIAIAAGEKNRGKIADATISSVVLGIGAASCFFILFILFSGKFVNIYLNEAEPGYNQIVEVSISIFVFAAIIKWFELPRNILSGVSYGLGKPIFPLVVSIIGNVGVGFGILLVAIMLFEPNIFDLWAIILVSEVTMAVLFFVKIRSILDSQQN